jgi:dimethylhistidine N-methyltransferase
MATYLETVELERLATADERQALSCEVRRGLIARPRSLSPWMFYDAEGSRLFERITTLPEYYPTRTERAIFAGNADAIVAAAHTDRSLPLRLVEFGAGSASKTRILLEGALRLSDDVVYVPVDVCSDALEQACHNVAYALPQVRLQPIVRNYVTHPLQLEPFDGTTLALYIGTSIGNFSPEEARLIMREFRAQLQAGDALLLGTDMVKDERILLAAYDDRDGITTAFNLNILHRLNKELGATFDAARFRHRVLWNSVESRIEMHLESTREQDVSIADAELYLHFMAGETIHTENSDKFTDRSIRNLLNESGFETRGHGKTVAVGIPSRLRASGSACGDEDRDRMRANWQDSRHRSIDVTIARLFITQTSVFMTRVDRLQSECRQPGKEREHEDTEGAHNARSYRQAMPSQGDRTNFYQLVCHIGRKANHGRDANDERARIQRWVSGSRPPRQQRDICPGGRRSVP